MWLVGTGPVCSSLEQSGLGVGALGLCMGGVADKDHTAGSYWWRAALSLALGAVAGMPTSWVN